MLNKFIYHDLKVALLIRKIIGFAIGKANNNLVDAFA